MRGWREADGSRLDHGRQRPARSAVGASHETRVALDLQRLAGNRAVAPLLKASRDGLSVQRGKGNDQTRKKRANLRSLRDKSRAAVAEYALRTLLEDVWTTYAGMGDKQAKEKCEEAAKAIGSKLRDAGKDPEYLGVAWWSPPTTQVSLNHYVVVVDDMVIDATGHQFRGGSASITPFAEWFADLQDRLKPPTLARWVQGTLADARALGGIAHRSYHEAERRGFGHPLHDYDATFLARVAAIDARMGPRPPAARR